MYFIFIFYQKYYYQCTNTPDTLKTVGKYYMYTNVKVDCIEAFVSDNLVEIIRFVFKSVQSIISRT